MNVAPARRDSGFSLRDMPYQWLVLKYWMMLGQFHQYPARPLRKERFPKMRCANLPSIAIVTPSFQQAPFVERTLRSVLDQDYPRLQYAVQDGGSTDDSVEILTRFASQLTSYESAPDGGQADAIVRGFAKVSGEVMAWLNADDLLMPGALHYVG